MEQKILTWKRLDSEEHELWYCSVQLAREGGGAPHGRVTFSASIVDGDWEFQTDFDADLCPRARSFGPARSKSHAMHCAVAAMAAWSGLPKRIRDWWRDLHAITEADIKELPQVLYTVGMNPDGTWDMEHPTDVALEDFSAFAARPGRGKA